MGGLGPHLVNLPWMEGTDFRKSPEAGEPARPVLVGRRPPVSRRGAASHLSEGPDTWDVTGCRRAERHVYDHHGRPASNGATQWRVSPVDSPATEMVRRAKFGCHGPFGTDISRSAPANGGGKRPIQTN